MAFGDKPTWSNNDAVTVVDLPLPEEAKVKRLSPASQSVTCCDDSFNFSVELNTGIPFCLKCHKTITTEHFNGKLNEYAANAKGNR